MRKIISPLAAFIFLILCSVTPVFAQSGDIGKIQSFIQNVIQVLVTLAGLTAAGFFVWGGFGYITSSGNPEHLDRSKRTIFYSALGLAIVLGAFVLSNIVAQMAGTAFGTSTPSVTP